jgi:hypothetical protein
LYTLREVSERIEDETIGAEELNLSLPVNARPEISDTSNIGDVMKFQRDNLSNLAFKREDVRLRPETIISNREMLTRMIFDYKTAFEALKLKKQAP